MASSEAARKKDKHKDGATRRKVWILCDKSRESRAEAGARRSASRKTDCPFKLTVTRSIDTSLWHVRVENSDHNHPASSNPSQHPCHRKLTDEEKSLIESLTHSHVPPKNILLNLLQQNPDTAVVSQDMWNERKRLRKERLNGKNPAEAVLDMMEDSGHYGHCVVKNPDSNRIHRIRRSLKTSKSRLNIKVERFGPFIVVWVPSSVVICSPV